MASNITELSNVQGDILLSGLNKEVETFWFFTIADSKSFCQKLRRVATEEISHTQNTLDTCRKIKDFKASEGKSPSAKLPTIGANFSFSFQGLQKIASVTGLETNTGDSIFEAGMKPAAVTGLQDPIKAGSDGKTPDWDADWLNKQVDGVLIVAGTTDRLVKEKLDRITTVFGKSAQLAFQIDGKVRPGTQRGKEHFGYQDGISQPVVGNLPNLTKEEMFVPPGHDVVPQGVVLCGRPGDANANTRPAWMLDGSFLCFRKLKQNVQDWDRFLVQSSNQLGTFADQLGSRFIGRWKSGCPINLQADFDDINIGKDVKRNNHFEFDPPGLNAQSQFVIKSGDRMICPLGAHIRKTNPRGDQPRNGRESVNTHRILRRGIPYGPEISEHPTAERGLLFACYQSNLSQGFEFIQRLWANNEFFRFGGAGVDAVMGQTNEKATVGMKGLFPQDASRELQLPGVNRFVVPRGGEYFFSPSLSALKGELSNVQGAGVEVPKVMLT